MPIYTSPLTRLYYETTGQGRHLLLISGLGGGSWSWYGQVPFFKLHYRVITFDNRGAGRSGMPPGPYRMQEMAEDALQLLDHLQIPRACVLSLSMGGMIALELAYLAPDRICALLLGCTHFGGPGHIPCARETVEKLIDNSGLSHEEIIRKNIPLFFSRSCIQEQPEVIEAYRAALLGAPHQPEYAFHAQLAAIQSFDFGDRLPSIKVPTLVVTGSEDVLIPPGNSEIMAQQIPNAEHVVIAGAGHALHAECRDTLNHLAHDFFSRHPC